MEKLNHSRAAVDSTSVLGDSELLKERAMLFFSSIQHRARSPVSVCLVAILLKIDVDKGSLSS